VERANAFRKRNIPVRDVTDSDAGSMEAGSTKWSSGHYVMLDAWLHAGPEIGIRFRRALRPVLADRRRAHRAWFLDLLIWTT